MSNQQDIKACKEGNYVNYYGPVGHFPMSRIVEMEYNEDGSVHSYLLTHKQKPNNFRGYPQQVQPIYLEPEHLTKLGFHQNPKTKIWQLIELNIIRIAYPKGQVTALTHHDEGFFIYNPLTAVPQEPDQLDLNEIRANTTSILHVHEFQNYTIAQGRQIDFSVLES